MQHLLSFMLQLGNIVLAPVYFVISLIKRLFSKSLPPITLENPDVKYALRMIDKEVTNNLFSYFSLLSFRLCYSRFLKKCFNTQTEVHMQRLK